MPVRESDPVLKQLDELRKQVLKAVYEYVYLVNRQIYTPQEAHRMAWAMTVFAAEHVLGYQDPDPRVISDCGIPEQEKDIVPCEL